MRRSIIATDAAEGWRDKLADLRAWIRERDAVLIAVSGGIDSTFLWHVAHAEIGVRALAVTAVSPSLASWERDQLGALVAEIGGRHRTVDTGELSNPSYAANPANRCFYCKDTLWNALGEIAAAEGIAQILDGYNLDDVGDYRPGQAAGAAHGIASPLKLCGFRKADIRAAAESLGLSIWAKPAMACLSSRFAYGVAISAEGLAQVDAAERWLRERGFAELRVRVHADKLARVELPVGSIDAFLSQREAFVAMCKALGFLYVSLDLSGFKSGSMNAVLSYVPATSDAR
jgi:pyridinium-3,5-biscarboxylic acid mononucleotide sulfurtransferase